jgi:hypothetical protein
LVICEELGTWKPEHFRKHVHESMIYRITVYISITNSWNAITNSWWKIEAVTLILGNN